MIDTHCPRPERPSLCRLVAVVLVLAALSACAGVEGGDASPTPEAEATPTPEPIDGRPEFPEPPAYGLQIKTPEVVIEPGQERLFCYFTTYTGDDAGVHSATLYQSRNGHHNLVFLTQSSLYEDGAIVDCDLADQPTLLASSSLLVFPKPVEPNVQESVLPDGMAIKFGRYSRVMLQMHYINTSSDRVRVQDVVNLNFIDPHTVSTWAAPFTHSDIALTLPPHQTTTSSIACPFPGNYNILYLSGHMHWYGKAFSATLSTDAGDRVIYQVPDWEVDYMELPPINEYAPGEFKVQAGDVLTSTCTWDNTGDVALEFPDEMCASFGLLYPSDRTLECTYGG